MKLSLARLLSIPALNAAVPAVCAATTWEEFHDCDYSLTQSDAEDIAKWLDVQYAEIEPIGRPTLFLEAQTPESYLDACRSHERACAAAKEVIRVCGLNTPAVWCEPVS